MERQKTWAEAMYSATTPDTPVTTTAPTTALGGTPAQTPRERLDQTSISYYGPNFVPLPIPANATYAEALYRPHMEMHEVLRPHQDTLSDVLGRSTAERQSLNRAAVEIRQTGLSTLDSKVIVDAVVSDLVAATRGTELDLEQRTQQWQEASRRQAREEFGAKGYDTEDLARRAEAFVSKHRVLHDALVPSGLMWKPDIVMALVNHVRLNGVNDDDTTRST